MKTKILALMAAGLLTMSLVGPAFAAADKAEFCHLNNTNKGNGMDNWSRVEVSGGAIATHEDHMNDYRITPYTGELEHTEPHDDGVNHITSANCDTLVAGGSLS